MPKIDDTSTNATYQPPVLVLLGSVEAITMSSQKGSFSDFKGRTDKRP